VSWGGVEAGIALYVKNSRRGSGGAVGADALAASEAVTAAGGLGAPAAVIAAGGLDAPAAVIAAGGFGAGVGPGTAGARDASGGFAATGGPAGTDGRGTTGGRASGAPLNAVADSSSGSSTLTASPHELQNFAPVPSSEAQREHAFMSAADRCAPLARSFPHSPHSGAPGGTRAPHDEQYAAAIDREPNRNHTHKASANSAHAPIL
jgi:hypothetical protein